ncbi:ribosome silencing factor [Nisaea acidiphila]|uniref:Ribosomal silencing factor RsfS n=1 Tax=Nisaea acidiphila TaxID=1862145 RepID=A0A9J7B0Q3_9PROT|nr:ribosome silencing factor [Nisaea acidiphila]UUX52233.1 ribosome silencing factor [Nisaea acidiphila]
MPKKAALPSRESLVDLASRSLDDSKAEDIVVIDLEGKSSISDHMLIASGRSTRQVAAMAEHLIEKLKSVGVKGISVEGQSQGDWVLIDAGDIIVHLFRPEVREFYALEKMWGSEPPARGRVVQIGDAAEAREMAHA